MENHDIYDMFRNKTDKTAVRGEVLNAGEFRMAVTVCIFNAKGEMLIQKRQSFKDDWSNMWDFSTAGSALCGETPQEAAEREAFEELGLKLNLSGIRPRFTVNFDGGFNDYFIIEKDIELSSLKLQYEEVQAVKWANKDEIISKIDKGEFITYYHGLVELLFDSREKYGAHSSESLK